MWENFMTSIGLLTIAMMSALYSSSAARDGRVVSAGVSALLALVIAVWVGIRFVPRLAKSVDWDWLPFFTHYQITKEGWIYFATVTVVVFAAINTANNLLYMVLSALLAVLLLSGFLSGLNFRYIDAAIRIPATCHANEPFPISIRARNEKRVFPTFSMQFEAPGEEIKQLFRLRPSTVQFPAFYVPMVRARQTEFQSGNANIQRRGRYEIKEVKARSRYPFGFFAKDRTLDVNASIICYPEILPPERMNMSVLDILGSNQRFERGLGYDLYTIRDYLPSDSARHVHWKASAKTAVLKTREYAAEESRRLVLAFDRFGYPRDTEKFEHLVSYAASLAYHMMKADVEVAVVSDDWQSGYGASEILLDSILRYFALVEMSSDAPPPPLDSRDGALPLSLR